MECYSSVLSVKCVDNVQICYIVIDFSVYILSYIERRLERRNGKPDSGSIQRRTHIALNSLDK